MALMHLVYLSSASELLSPEGLQTLLVQSRTNNEEEGITGLLVYRDGSFLQAIEGEEKAVRLLFKKIVADHRHCGVTVLFDEPITERDFAEWSMGFRDLDARSEQLTGFNDIFHQRPEHRALSSYPPKVRAFMKSFLK